MAPLSSYNCLSSEIQIKTMQDYNQHGTVRGLGGGVELLRSLYYPYEKTIELINSIFMILSEQMDPERMFLEHAKLLQTKQSRILWGEFR